MSDEDELVRVLPAVFLLKTGADAEGGPSPAG
jgi:hypothetical protein